MCKSFEHLIFRSERVARRRRASNFPSIEMTWEPSLPQLESAKGAIRKP